MPEPAAIPSLTELGEEEALLRQNIREIAENRLRPLVRAMDEAAHFDAGLLADFFQLGLMGIQIPERWGGAGGSFFDAVLTVEELSRVDPAAGVIVDVQNTLVNSALLRWGRPEQQERYLPKLAGQWLGAYALSEAGAGSDAFALSTRATPAAGGYRLQGRKLWITNALEAELFIIFATLDPAAGYRGVTAFLAERSTAGLQVGKKEEKLGIRASSTCELILENCFLPATALLGEAGRGYKIAIETLNEGRIGIGAQMLGLAAGALAAATQYARQRRQFGQLIAEFQAVQFQLAELYTELEAARLLVYNAARRKDAGLDFLREAAMAKLYAARAAERIASQAVEIFGGLGLTREAGVEKLYRDAKIGSIYEGTTNMQLQTIAKTILREPC